MTADDLPHVDTDHPAITEQHIRVTEAYIREWDIDGPIHALIHDPATVNAAVDWWNAGAAENPAGSGPTPGSEGLAQLDTYLAAGGQMPVGMDVDAYRESLVRNDRENRARRRQAHPGYAALADAQDDEDHAYHAAMRERGRPHN